MSTSLTPVRDSAGLYRARASFLSESAILTAAREILERRYAPGQIMGSVSDTQDFLAMRFHGRDHEVFGVLFLDNRHHVLAFEELFTGTVDSATIHPRIVVQRALSYGAAAVVLAHNHPSGVNEPSDADRQMTERLQQALALIDVRVLDHLIAGRGKPVSFAERGLL